MAEGKYGIDDVKVAGKRVLYFVIDYFVIFERIVALKRFKVGYLSEIIKIYRRFDEYFKDYKFLFEVRSENYRLDI